MWRVSQKMQYGKCPSRTYYFSYPDLRFYSLGQRKILFQTILRWEYRDAIHAGIAKNCNRHKNGK